MPICFYLVRNDETIDTAEYDIQNLEFAESTSEVLPSDYYEVIAVYEDDNEEQVLLDRTALFGFELPHLICFTRAAAAL